MILFVGDSPSSKNIDKNKAFIGTQSYKVLSKWINILEINDYMLCNRIDENIFDLCKKTDKIVGLGINASKFLSKHGINHYKFMHPSPRNRKLNDNIATLAELMKLKNWIHNV